MTFDPLDLSCSPDGKEVADVLVDVSGLGVSWSCAWVERSCYGAG